MPKTILAMIALFALIGGPAVGGEEYSPTQSEQLGSLRTGLSATKLKGAIDCQPKRGPEELWGADGAYHQQWVYADCGIELGMVSGNEGGAKTIESIKVSAPSRLTTKRGIRIGSTEQAVKKAYQAHRNAEDSESAGDFVVGSLFDGLIFSFKDGKVSSIFLGAASE